MPKKNQTDKQIKEKYKTLNIISNQKIANLITNKKQYEDIKILQNQTNKELYLILMDFIKKHKIKIIQ